ncbi:MAG: efflux RND transporter periplasmic adaptor subunit [Deltaproteobacteria bacterium]|nr:efflux RND transporter periplasmic adaptor subunit [Deltaproteobacteria bacterium]
MVSIIMRCLRPYAAFLVLFALPACKGAEGKGGEVEDPPVPVQTEPVALETARVVVTATGTVEGRSDVSVVAEAPGKIKKVLFELGDEVKEGQALLKLDKKVQRLAVQQARAQIEQAKAASELADLHRERMQGLLDEGSASQSEIDKVNMEAKSASASLTMAKVALGQANHALSTTNVTSPITGTVTLKMATRGQMLAAGMPVAQVTDLTSLKVTVGLTEREISDLTVGMKVEVSSPVNPDVRSGGTIAAIGLKAIGPTRAFPVEVWIEEPDPRLHPGMTVNLRIFVAEIEDVIMAHVNDVFEDEAGTYVWVVDGSRAVRRDVATGRRLDEKVMITSGLAQGERMVVKGGDLLRDGAAVTDTAAGKPPSASGG